MPDPLEHSESSTITIIEWRHTGHRLSYLRGIVDAAAGRGIALEIVTQAAALQSEEWRVHLGDVPDLVVTVLAPERFEASELPAVLRGQRRLGRSVVVPEVDRVLHAVALAFLTRQLPRRTTIIAMRPPKWSEPRKWLASIAKVVALRLLAATHSVSVLLLEDPLASGRNRVWGPPLSSATLRLDDPADEPDRNGQLPDELSRLAARTKIIALTGAIDDRKQAPLILDGWDQSRRIPTAHWLSLGSRRKRCEEALDVHPATKRSDVILIDRYLDSIGPVVNRCVAMFVLFDGGLASGTLGSAAPGRAMGHHECGRTPGESCDRAWLRNRDRSHSGRRFAGA